MRLWLYALSNASKNGTSNVIYRNLMIEYKLTLPEAKFYFNPEQAQKLDLIKILAKTDTFISVNFKNKVVKLPTVNEPKIKPKPKEVVATTNLETVKHDDRGLIIGPLPQNYVVSHKLRTILIGYYCQFYKNLIVYRAALVGNVITTPANPKLNPHDPKAFDEIIMHLLSNGIKTEQAIIYVFCRVYESWHLMPDNIQNYYSPAEMSRNWTKIYEKMTTIGKKPTTKNKKDEELTEKLNSTQQKDYSHLARS